MVADFLGDFRPYFWVSDRYGGQMGWATVNNQVCLAHLIRDVQYAIDGGDDIFAPDCNSAWGPDADRRGKTLISLAAEGSLRRAD